jgi:hypothetical protein
MVKLLSYFKSLHPLFCTETKPTKTKLDWQRLAWDTQERHIKVEQKIRAAEKVHTHYSIDNNT